MRSLGERVLVRPIVEEVTKGGIVIPHSAQERAFAVMKGTIVSVGTWNALHNGRPVELPVRVGEVLYYREEMGQIPVPGGLVTVPWQGVVAAEEVQP